MGRGRVNSSLDVPSIDVNSTISNFGAQSVSIVKARKYPGIMNEDDIEKTLNAAQARKTKQREGHS